MGHVNLKLIVAYDGTKFHGWQMQKDQRTVQGDLEMALGKVLGGNRVVVWGAGRTDAGVHARGQVAHTKVNTALPPEQLRKALNSYLAGDVQVLSVAPAADDFHARFSASWRRYSYTISTVPLVIGRQYAWQLDHDLDSERLSGCAALVQGSHDFVGFSKAREESESQVCQVHESAWERPADRWVYTVRADHFLHHMVRYLVGTMVDVARGRFSVDQFTAHLAGQPDSLKILRAPAAGLVLEEVAYAADG